MPKDFNSEIPNGYVKISQEEIECDCICHTVDDVIHCMPCCDECPKCGKNIKGQWFEAHVKVCGTIREIVALQKI